jgi:hypothetical protein
MENEKIYDILFEQTESNALEAPEENVSAASTVMKTRKSLDSVDDQIDALVLRYEASSIREENPIEDQDLMEQSLYQKTLNYLFEQDEDAEPEPEAEAVPAEEPDVEAEEPVGSEKLEQDAAVEQKVPDLDIDAFAMRTVRLITNYKNLLRVEDAIINRVKNFLDENYGDPFVSEYLEILDKQFGIATSEFPSSEVSDDNFAVGAYAGGTGGLGGGGA